MNTIEMEARAKINLTLDIVGKRYDGYHNVDMIMQSITLADKLKFKSLDNDIRIQCNKAYIPLDRRNIVYKTAELIKGKYNIAQGVDIYIEKNIPVSAGLGGGSSNAAVTLIALNKLWNLNLDHHILLTIAAQIGADVPFCILGGTAIAEGIGEKLTNITPLPRFHIVLANPRISISTSWAYSLIKLEQIKGRPDNKEMAEAIYKGNRHGIALLLSNVFEQFIFEKYPQLISIKKDMKDLGAIGTLMSGSGPTIYGLFDEELAARKAHKELSKRDYEVILSQTFNLRR